VASLLYSLVPALTPTQVRQILQNTVTAFPGGSTCNTTICGTGIVNAANAVSLLPRITSLNPVSATVGGVTLTLVVNGANFTAGSVVNWNGTPRTTGFVSSSQLTVTVTAADRAAPSFVNLTVSGSYAPYGSMTTVTRTFPIYNASFGPRVYLPLVMKPAPVPSTPTLNAISNADGNGVYLVTWTFVTGAESYTLQEDDNASFSSPTAVYTGPNLSWPASGKTPGTYYYRVRATNGWGSSGWSATQAVVVQQTATGPTPGFWESQTGDEFYVSPDSANVLNFAIYITVPSCNNNTYKITRITPVSIVGNQFSFSGSFYASGTFNSATTASGTDGLSSHFIVGCGTVSGGPWSWSATWQNSTQPSMSATTAGPDETMKLTTVTVPHTAYRVDTH
jgi:hypothetical protein